MKSSVLKVHYAETFENINYLNRKQDVVDGVQSVFFEDTEDLTRFIIDNSLNVVTIDLEGSKIVFVTDFQGENILGTIELA